jgi:hypothetical protein
MPEPKIELRISGLIDRVSVFSCETLIIRPLAKKDCRNATLQGAAESVRRRGWNDDGKRFARGIEQASARAIMHRPSSAQATVYSEYWK